MVSSGSGVHGAAIQRESLKTSRCTSGTMRSVNHFERRASRGVVDTSRAVFETLEGRELLSGGHRHWRHPSHTITPEGLIGHFTGTAFGNERLDVTLTGDATGVTGSVTSAGEPF